MDVSTLQKIRQSILLLLIPKLYNIGLKLYGLIIHIAALKNQKAKLWIKGRKHTFSYLEKNISKSEEIVWIHTPSLGEFEQARPLIEAIKNQHSNYKILLTFYSPSGYEVRKSYPLADCICYLPLDTKKNAKTFIDIVNPSITFFVKYDFWANYLNELQSKNLKHYVIAAIFRENQYFFQKRNKWMLNILSKIDHYFVQNENSRKLLENHEINQVSVVNDTRFDRVLDIAKNRKDLPLIKLFKGEKPLFIAGSTWAKGEEIIQKLIMTIDNRFKYIIAPHEINETQIAKLEEKIKSKTIRYSIATKQNISSAQVLIIDNIGMLSALYAYADIAYIGGGFGKGIHNILEPATFGMPIFIGLNNAKFKEAQDLKEIGVAKEINSDKEMIRHCEYFLNNKNHWNELKIKSKQYVHQNSGATKKIVESVFSIKD